jgi:diacylglycerol kinase (ATP)
LAWRHEQAFRLEATAALLLFPCSFWLAQSLGHQLILVASLALVVIVELINSAIEAVVDRIGSDIHPLSAQAKDIGSAAVFISLMLVLLLWGLSLWDLLS